MLAKIKLSGCNLNCEYCPISNRGGKKGNDFDKIMSFIKYSSAEGIKHLKWSGGEPTIYNRFLEGVEYAKNLGMYQSVSTNGTFDSSFIQKMKDAGVNRLNISLDTLSDKQFKSITGSDYCERVIGNILHSELLFPLTKINVLVMDKNFNELVKIYQKFKSEKIMVRYLQLTYKGNDGFVDTHRIDNKTVEDIMPINEEINFGETLEFTNPVAKHYKDGKYVFAIIPQHHNCDVKTCKKLWYEEGVIYTCKIRRQNLHADRSTVRFLIENNCYKQPGVHRIIEEVKDKRP